MAYVHQFGIIDCIEENKDYEYEPNKYSCICVDGDFIDEIYHKGFGDKMNELDTFANNTNRPYKNLAYYGTTLIPPKSLYGLKNILIEENIIYKSKEIECLVSIISQAIEWDKWIIHYGI